MFFGATVTSVDSEPELYRIQVAFSVNALVVQTIQSPTSFLAWFHAMTLDLWSSLCLKPTAGAAPVEAP